jgi:hypothetical protein
MVVDFEPLEIGISLLLQGETDLLYIKFERSPRLHVLAAKRNLYTYGILALHFA